MQCRLGCCCEYTRFFTDSAEYSAESLTARVFGRYADPRSDLSEAQGMSASMEKVFSDAANYLSRYRVFLTAECGLSSGVSSQIAAESYAKKQALYLLLFREIVRCQLGAVDDDAPEVFSLSIATYGIFRAVVAMDGVIDGAEESRAQLALQTFVHFEAATRNSTAILKNFTYSQRNMRRLMAAYLGCYDHERHADVSDQRLAKLLFRKSCMVLLPIAWARDIYGPSDKQLTLRCALIKLFVALQIIDDLRDVIEDDKVGQQTLYRRHLKASLDVRSDGLLSVAQLPDELLSRVDQLHLISAERRLSQSIILFRKAGSEVLAYCVGLVHTEVCRHRALLEKAVT